MPNSAQGRFPANLLLDERAAEMLDAQSGQSSRFFYVAKASKRERNAGCEGGIEYALKPDTPEWVKERVLALVK